MKEDIFTLLEQTALPESGQDSLPVLSLWRETTYYLTFFTFHPDKFTSHYDEEKRQYLCLGESCPACAAGVRATEHVYLPVWDVQSRRVAVLKFDTRPDGPAAKILGFLKSYKDQLAEVVAVVICKGEGKFTITAHEPDPEADRGALACDEFCRMLATGTVSLRNCVKRLSEEEVAALKSVRRSAVPAVGARVMPAAPSRPAASSPAGDPVPPAAGRGEG